MPNPRLSMFRGRVGAPIALAVILAACGGSGTPPSPTPAPAPASASLKYFSGDDACSALEQHIEDRAQAMIEDQLVAIRDGPGGGIEVLPAPVTSVGAPSGDAAASPTAPRHSTTNVQVAGVDEFDTIKNDDRHLYAFKADGSQLALSKLRLWPAESMAMLGQARWSPDVAVTGHQMPVGLVRLDAGRLAALTTGAGAVEVMMDGLASAAGAPMICAVGRCGGPPTEWKPPRTVLTLFDTSADAAPAATWSTTLPGRLLGARRIGQKIYAVTESDLQMPQAVRWWPAFLPSGASPEQWRAAFDQLIANNRIVIRDATLAHWLAPLAADGAAATPTAEQCRGFAQVDVPTRLAWLRVNTIDVDTRGVAHETVLAEGADVAMSGTALYVNTTYWRRDDTAGGRTATYLHRFALEPAGRAKYASTGALSGTMLDAYALDEDAAGVVRVAMSDFDPTRRPFTYLATLRPGAPSWTTLGRTAAIAPGETLQSVRFVGERAYLVTFRQVDPFFVFDLSDPTQPRQLGELKLPGFSTYLHPADDTHLVGIGYDDGGWPRRVKASLFDVSDAMRPVEQSGVALGDVFSGSEALWDPHAFTWLPGAAAADDALMAIPMRSFEAVVYGTPRQSRIRLARFHPDRGLRDAGTLTMPAPSGSSAWTDYARRALFIGDAVYGYSDSSVRAARVGDPSTPVATVSIP